MEAGDSYHTPVLLQNVLNFLLTNPHGIYVDATLGGGGHAEGLLERLSPDGRLIGIDADPEAVSIASERLKRFTTQTSLVRSGFGNLARILEDLGISRINGILFDFGVSSRQLDDPAKGFSFRTDSRLDMRMGPDAPIDAHSLINTYPIDELGEIFWKYGEEKQSRKIARAIGASRERAVIETTGDLARIVEGVTGAHRLTKSLARIFQAIRIEVNGELEQIAEALVGVMDFLEPGSRIVAISYHSLEDRIVKEFFKKEAAQSIPGRHKLEADTPREPRLLLLTRTPIQPAGEETDSNPRARSAKLRAAERLGDSDRAST